MLARRKKPRMTERPQTVSLRHQKFVRGFVCIVPGCDADRRQFCHRRKGLPPETPDWARGGGSQKPHDAFGFPACDEHHREQHDTGEDTFAEKYGIDPLKESRLLALASPDPEVREFRKGLSG